MTVFTGMYRVDLLGRMSQGPVVTVDRGEIRTKEDSILQIPSHLSFVVDPLSFQLRTSIRVQRSDPSSVGYIHLA